MKKIAIVDYGMGNLDSIARAVEECGAEPIISESESDFEPASSIILPGVGAFAEGMRNIREKGLEAILNEQVMDKKVPFLGICLGMQLLATEGYEGGKTRGLGWIEGSVEKLKSYTQEERIPHIGWNEVIMEQDTPIFDGITSGKDFYFVHSYQFICQNPSRVIARTPYCGSFISAIGRDNIFGVQFHPEKSQRLGLRLLNNFLKL